MSGDLIGAIPTIDLPGGYVVKFEARDPTTGAAVANVRVTNAVLYGAKADAAAVAQQGPVAALPSVDLSWLPVPVASQPVDTSGSA